MKKYFISVFTFLMISVFALQSCEKEIKSEKKESTPIITHQNNVKTDKAEEWLKNIFKCNNPNGFCYYLDQEEKICTKRFMEFLIDSNEIYGASNLTEKELPEAEKKYRKKWSKIYPLYSEEMWLFGRGNDDAENIKEVKIKKIANLKYRVFIDYGEGMKTENEVTLIPVKNSFKIDYCKTKFL